VKSASERVGIGHRPGAGHVFDVLAGTRASRGPCLVWSPLTVLESDICRVTFRFPRLSGITLLFTRITRITLLFTRFPEKISFQ
jgi:hypothetical protein